MAQERLTMRKIAEVLRLKWECQQSNRAIARSCSISHSTVAEYLRRAQEAGLSWPLPAGVGEDTLYELLFRVHRMRRSRAARRSGRSPAAAR